MNIKILCPGGYTSKNKGDAALVQAMLTELKRVFPDASIKLISDTPKRDAQKYQKIVLPPVFGATIEEDLHREKRTRLHQKVFSYYSRYIGWRTPVSFRRFFTRPASQLQRLVSFDEVTKLYLYLIFLRTVTFLLGRRCHWLFPKAQKATALAFCEADAVIFVPGGYLISPNPSHSHWLRHVAAIFLAHWLRKPIYLYSCSLGPFHGKRNQWLAREALKCATSIFLREPSSEFVASRLAPNVPRFLATDVAFLLDDRPAEEKKKLKAQYLKESDAPIIGISVRDYTFPGHSYPDAQRSQYFKAMADVSTHLAKKYHAEVFFVPQVLADEVNDVEISMRIYESLPSKKGINVIDADLDPQQLKGLYASFDAFIGVRMHANIFALSNCVPTLAIAYEPKTEGIMQFLQLGEYVLNIRNIEATALIERVDLMMANRTRLRSHLHQVIPKARETASQPADIIKKHFCFLYGDCKTH